MPQLPYLLLPWLILFYAVTPGIVASQNSPANDKQESTVQTQMRNVPYHFSDTIMPWYYIVRTRTFFEGPFADVH